MTKVESRVLNFLKEHFDVVVIIAVTVVAILIRFLITPTMLTVYYNWSQTPHVATR